MFSNQKIKGYVFLFLLFCVLSSKNIIIYNEETLVALSFITFVLFSLHYFGNTVQESLDERSFTIKKQLESLSNHKQEYLHELANEHKRISKLKQILPTIGAFTEKQLSLQSSRGHDTGIQSFKERLEQKVINLSSSHALLQQRLQTVIANNIQTLLLTKVKSGKPLSERGHQHKEMIQKSIQLLRNNR